MCVAWGCHVPTDTPPKKKWAVFFWQAHSRHGILRQYPMNLAPFEKSCEPLIKELLSQRSIPLPEKIQEAMKKALPRWLFQKHFSVVIYVIHKRCACIVVLFYGHWLIFGCPGTLQELAAGIGIFCHCCFAVLQVGLVWYQYWSQLPSLRRSLWAQRWAVAQQDDATKTSR